MTSSNKLGFIQETSLFLYSGNCTGQICRENPCKNAQDIKSGCILGDGIYLACVPLSKEASTTAVAVVCIFAQLRKCK